MPEEVAEAVLFWSLFWSLLLLASVTVTVNPLLFENDVDVKTGSIPSLILIVTSCGRSVVQGPIFSSSRSNVVWPGDDDAEVGDAIPVSNAV